MTLPAHFLLLMLSSHLWIAGHLIPHMWLARRTSGSSHFGGVHFRLVSADVFPVALIFGLEPVCVCSGFSCPSVTRSRALPIMFSHISAVVFSFSRSLTVNYVPRFISSFSSARCRSLALAFG
jgi:hypothetical protein